MNSNKTHKTSYLDTTFIGDFWERDPAELHGLNTRLVEAGFKALPLDAQAPFTQTPHTDESGNVIGSLLLLDLGGGIVSQPNNSAGDKQRMLNYHHFAPDDIIRAMLDHDLCPPGFTICEPEPAY